MEYINLEPKLNETLCTAFSGGIPEFIQVGKEKWLFPANFLENAESYKNFLARSDDVWITGFPRSGTTLTESICWLLTHNFDTNRAKAESIVKRVPFFEVNTVTTKEQIAYLKKVFENPSSVENFHEDAAKRLENLDSMTERRVIKTHLPYSLGPNNWLSSGCKIVYVARNVKDVFVSCYQFHRAMQGRAFTGTIEEYFGFFEQNLLLFNPYWEHIKQGWERRNDKNFMFFFYEDIRKDLEGTVRKIAKFLEIDFNEEQLKSVLNFMQFDNFRLTINDLNKKYLDLPGCLKEKEHGFVRQGKVEGWKDSLSEELNNRMNRLLEKNMKKLGLDGSYPITIQKCLSS